MSVLVATAPSREGDTWAWGASLKEGLSRNATWSLSLPPPHAQEGRTRDVAVANPLLVLGALHLGGSPSGDQTMRPVVGVSSGRSRGEKQGGRGSPTSEARRVDARGSQTDRGKTGAVLEAGVPRAKPNTGQLKEVGR